MREITLARHPMAVVCLTLVVAAVAGSRLAFAKAKLGRYQVGAGPALGTVYDTTTKLTWQRDGLVAGEQPWFAANAFCAKLLLNGGGWRLPNVVELSSIVDRSGGSPAIDLAAFPKTAGSSYWSSTKHHPMPQAYAWEVDLHYGVARPEALAVWFHIRCVR